jgi:hypothetical protein
LRERAGLYRDWATHHRAEIFHTLELAAGIGATRGTNTYEDESNGCSELALVPPVFARDSLNRER